MIVYAPRFGLGNIIQTSPAVHWLSQHHEVSLLVSGATREYVKAVFGNRFPLITSAPKGAKIIKSANPGEFRHGGSISEVALNLKHAGCPDWESVEHKANGFCEAPDYPESFDLVIANGYNKTRNISDWEAKTYPHWEKVINLLPGLRIACVGNPGEAIPGAIDLTGIGLAQTFGVIKKARCFASNDTGLYHAAAAMKVKGIALFTFTDKAKNHDAAFHSSISLLSRYLPCSPCQLKGKHHWIKQRPICGWECRNIPPDFVAQAILKKL